MKLKFDTPSVVIVTESKEFFETFEKEIKAKFPDLKCFHVGKRVAYKHLPKFKEKRFAKEGYDWWIPKESVRTFARPMLRKIRQFVR